MRSIISLFILIGLSVSCSELNDEIEEEYSPSELYCLNYDISYDTLFMTSLSVVIDGVMYNRSINSHGGAQNLLGAIGFDGDTYNFFFHAMYEDTIYLEHELSGSFDYTHDRLVESSTFKSYIKYGTLNLYDSQSGDSITNIIHRLHFGTEVYRFEFLKDEIEYKAFFE